MPILDNSSLPYGSFAEPIDFGSGGGNSGDDLGGAGGGVIFINTTELFIFGYPFVFLFIFLFLILVCCNMYFCLLYVIVNAFFHCTLDSCVLTVRMH